jgi:hypothetical protein
MIHVKFIQYQFWCTRCAFWQFISLQWCLGRKILNSKMLRLQRFLKPRTECHEMEPNLSKDRALHEKSIFHVASDFTHLVLCCRTWRKALMRRRCPYRGRLLTPHNSPLPHPVPHPPPIICHPSLQPQTRLSSAKITIPKVRPYSRVIEDWNFMCVFCCQCTL